ncbi:Crp/Fnr family transcriptional regulator [Hanstruepera neustonica]|uniref:Crp/Fnr family transcriptional regulator n=1 Tax=Hanstruepera neustonica TaxID=1445657 RepID=A0A2K1DVU6_9FLAO|nr:Crp/Fnr family transcriptional regulator [Hanstruepera neustonica]PNQ72166.1 Crp/Fnr family transcriptional regulator [Hanstruepera neustonica]
MKKTIESHLTFSEDHYNLLKSIATEKKVAKNQILFYPNKPVNKLLFLTKGLLRAYKIIDGKDYTHHFYFENWFATDFTSFLNNKPSQIYIESLEESIYYEFKKNDLNNLYNKSHQIERLGRIIAEKAFITTVEKVAYLQLLDLNEKYQALIKRNPSLFQRVPQKYIASYLGVSEQSLSRIKKKSIS